MHSTGRFQQNIGYSTIHLCNWVKVVATLPQMEEVDGGGQNFGKK